MKLNNNVMALSIKNCETYRDCLENAAVTSDRFMQSAALLPEGGCLGWQLNAAPEKGHRIFAFSGPRTQVDREDLDWIFRPCAWAEELPQDDFEALWKKNRRIYALCHDPNKRGKTPVKKRDYCCDLLKILGENGAVIRITADTSGMILVSLPGEMSLRLRTVLSLSFPDTAITELQPSGSAPDDPGRLPARYLTEVMAGLLGALLVEGPGTKDPEDPEEFLELPFLDDTENCTPIDELELSIRAYNCLKRAGINTVEELRAMSEEELRRVRNLGAKCIEEIRQKLAETDIQPAPAQQPAPNYSRMLEELIGLEGVKEQVKKITALAKMKQDMAAQGKDSVPVVLNMEFVGNPGTAKTTVARILAGIFHEAGLLAGKDLVEVGRADLVARYVGQTADLVKKVFHRAKGKLLFIDEAYSLVDDSAAQFGDEAINTIVQEMENNREDTIVIFAGYPDKMESLFAKNPGLRSRVPFHIHFADYSSAEMVQITDLEAKKRGFSLSSPAREKAAAICGLAAQHPDMGNGRFCRNLVESAVLSYASRVYGSGDASADKSFMLLPEDFSAPESLRKTKETPRIGFAA